MPSYDYKCNNDGCNNPGSAEKFCNIKESNVLPICPNCSKPMSKVFLFMPAVSWKYISPTGLVKKSSMGPCQRADRRHAGWDNGRKVLQPIYKGKRKEIVSNDGH